MRFAFSIMGWIVSAAFTSLACLLAVSVVTSGDFSSVTTRGMLFSVAGLITLALATSPFIHDGRSALATTGGVVAGFAVAIGFFTLTYLELTRFGSSVA
jgi:hypothetical protein